MLTTIKYCIRVLLLWLVVFAIAKIYFIGINFNAANDLAEVPAVLFHGLRLDLSIVGYVIVIPLLLSLLSLALPRAASVINKVYWSFIGIVIVIIVAVDPYFFSYWGQKTNLGFTQFLGKENAGLGSIETSTYVIALGFMAIALLWFFKSGLKCLELPKRASWFTSIILIGVSVLMIRGGIGKVPINISSAYYSSNNLYNNAALNSVWNFLAAEFEKDKHKPLVFFDSKDEAERILASYKSDTVDYRSLVETNDSTNVVLIVLESFSAKTVGFISGDKYGSTPELDKLMGEGIAYKNAYAASFRSDNGLLALTTGYPSSARQTLTNFPDKLVNKPNVFKSFDDSYSTGFYYGGNLEFANISVLFNDADIQKSKQDFDSKNKNTWGVHDNTVFEIFGNDFLAESKPQFKMLFSLSSHEPFDVPNFDRLENPYLNSIAYTDSCLGVLVNQLKQSEKWENTILIITADHGTIRPDNPPLYDTSNFKIPLLITGGLVKRDTIVNEVVSQSDIPATIAELSGKSGEYSQQSILTPSGKAFYSYHDGIVYVNKDGAQYYDLVQKRYLNDTIAPPVEKAYFQLGNEGFFKP